MRGLARLPRGPRRRLRRDLRRRGERVARLRGLAQHRPRRDVGALERGARLRRRRRPEGLEGLDARRRATAACSSASRRRASSRAATTAATLVAADDARRPARQRGLGRPGEPAARPPRHLGAHRRRRRPGPLLGDRAGRRPVRDDRRRRDVDAAQPRPARRLAAPARGGRLLRPQARPLAASTASACTSRTTSACTAATTAGHVDRDHRGAAERVRLRRRRAPARPRHLLRRSRSTPATAARMPEGKAAVWRTRDARLELAASSTSGLPQEDAHLGVLRAAMAIDAHDVPGLYFGTSTGQVFASADEGESWSEIASYLPRDLVGRGRGHRLSRGRRPPPAHADAALRRTCRAASRSTRRRSTRRSTSSTQRWPGLRDRLLRAGPGAPRRTSTSTSTRSGPSSTRRSTPRSRVDVIAAISGG